MHDQAQLGLRVRAQHGPCFLALEIVEVEFGDLLSCGAEMEDARLGIGHEAICEKLREQKRRKVVNHKVELVPLGGCAPFGDIRARTVDEKVNPVVAFKNLRCRATNVIEQTEVTEQLRDLPFLESSPRSLTTFCVRFGLRPNTQVLAPISAKRSSAVRPMPSVPPVKMIFFPLRSWFGTLCVALRAKEVSGQNFPLGDLLGTSAMTAASVARESSHEPLETPPEDGLN